MLKSWEPPSKVESRETEERERGLSFRSACSGHLFPFVPVFSP
jgi:hypothetical protein